MEFLYHFSRTPPGLIETINGVLKPQSLDIEDFKNKIPPKIKEMYSKGKFIYTIPKENLKAWKQSGQLDSLFDMLVKMEWTKYSVEQWKISISSKDLQKTFVRETYSISTKKLGFKDYMTETKEQKDKYNAA